MLVTAPARRARHAVTKPEPVPISSTRSSALESSACSMRPSTVGFIIVSSWPIGSAMSANARCAITRRHEILAADRARAHRARADRALPRVAPGSRSCSVWRRRRWSAWTVPASKKGKKHRHSTALPANLPSLSRAVAPKCRKSPRLATSPHAATISARSAVHCERLDALRQQRAARARRARHRCVRGDRAPRPRCADRASRAAATTSPRAAHGRPRTVRTASAAPRRAAAPPRNSPRVARALRSPPRTRAVRARSARLAAGIDANPRLRVRTCS